MLTNGQKHQLERTGWLKTSSEPKLYKNLFKHLFIDLSLIIAILINKAITIHNIKMCKS